MSSHHFVKEDQEPALIIVSVTHQTFEKINSLLEWSPRLIIRDAVLETVLEWGIKFDGVICKPDVKALLEAQLSDFLPLDWFIYNEDFLSETIEQLSNLGVKDIQLVDALENLSLSETEKASIKSISIITDTIRWSLVTSKKWEKWLPVHSTIFVKSEDKDLIINTTSDGKMLIEKENQFWVGEEW
jgi:hypothetical protein